MVPPLYNETPEHAHALQTEKNAYDRLPDALQCLYLMEFHNKSFDYISVVPMNPATCDHYDADAGAAAGVVRNGDAAAGEHGVDCETWFAPLWWTTHPDDQHHQRGRCKPIADMLISVDFNARLESRDVIEAAHVVVSSVTSPKKHVLLSRGAPPHFGDVYATALHRDKLVGDKLVGDKLVGDKLVGDKLVGDKLVGDETVCIPYGGLPLVALTHSIVRVIVRSKTNPGDLVVRYRVLPPEERMRTALQTSPMVVISPSPSGNITTSLYVVDGTVSLQNHPMADCIDCVSNCSVM
jgi:hypothetical protein